MTASSVYKANMSMVNGKVRQTTTIEISNRELSSTHKGDLRVAFDCLCQHLT